MEKIISLIQITRPINSIITFLVVVISAIVCLENYFISSSIILGGIAALLTTAAGNTINDYYDFEIDKINRPNRPIVSGQINKQTALFFYGILVLSSLIFSSIVSLNAFIIVFTTNLLLFLYSFKIKGILFLGNIVVAMCTGLAFIFGGILVNNIWASVIPALFAFQVNLVREVVKDIEDIEGDKKNNINTLPIYFSIQKSKIIILVLIILLITTTFIPFLIQLYKIEYFIIVLFLVDLPLVYLIAKICSTNYFNSLRTISNILKIIMIFGLIAIIVGVF